MPNDAKCRNELEDEGCEVLSETFLVNRVEARPGGRWRVSAELTVSIRLADGTMLEEQSPWVDFWAGVAQQGEQESEADHA